MKSAIADIIVHTSDVISPAAGPSDALLEIPTLRQKAPNVLATRLTGRHTQNAIDIRLTFDDGRLAETWVRATIWQFADGDLAFRRLFQIMSRRHGESRKRVRQPAVDGRIWHSSRHEVVTIEQRLSQESAGYMMQIIMIRRFKQPAASAAAPRSLTRALFHTTPSSQAGSMDSS